MMCAACRYYDPADGYCVMRAEYVREDGNCEKYAQPKKWLFLMEEGEHGGKDDP